MQGRVLSPVPSGGTAAACPDLATPETSPGHAVAAGVLASETRCCCEWACSAVVPPSPPSAGPMAGGRWVPQHPDLRRSRELPLLRAEPLPPGLCRLATPPRLCPRPLASTPWSALTTQAETKRDGPRLCHHPLQTPGLCGGPTWLGGFTGLPCGHGPCRPPFPHVPCPRDPGRAHWGTRQYKHFAGVQLLAGDTLSGDKPRVFPRKEALTRHSWSR